MFRAGAIMLCMDVWERCMVKGAVPKKEEGAEPDENCRFKELLKVDAALNTGLGDRLGLLLNIAALGEILHCKVQVSWKWRRVDSHYDPRDRPQDLFNWTIMSSLLQLPKNLLMLPELAFRKARGHLVLINELEATSGRQKVPHCAFWWWVSQSLLQPNEMESYIHAYNRVAQELQLASGVPPPPAFPYAVLHLRRLDLHPEVQPETENKRSADDFLLQAIALLLTKPPPHGLHPELPWIVLSDDESKTQLWETLITRGFNLNLASSRRRYGVYGIVSDFFIIAGSVGIVSSIPFRGGWSSFSAIPGFARQLPNLVVNVPYLGSRYLENAKLAGIDRVPNVFFFGAAETDTVRDQGLTEHIHSSYLEAVDFCHGMHKRICEPIRHDEPYCFINNTRRAAIRDTTSRKKL